MRSPAGCRKAVHSLGRDLKKDLVECDVRAKKSETMWQRS